MLILFLVTLFVPLLLGVPVAFSLVISAIVLMASQDLFSSQLIVQQFVGGINSFSLLAVPFFMLAGELMNKGGITRRIVDVVSIWVGRFCGGLGYVAIISSMIFAGLSGSAIADTAALGGVLIPMMSERGYGKSRATGIVISSGIIANIIPPSIGFILFGVVSGASISRMFMGGLVPGVHWLCTDDYLVLYCPEGWPESRALYSFLFGKMAHFLASYSGPAAAHLYHFRAARRYFYPYRSRCNCLCVRAGSGHVYL